MLYRTGMFAVIFQIVFGALILCAGTWLGAQAPMTQYGRKPVVDKGPRALGLVQLSATGKKARFIPICIMMDGKFYDAGSYKASPVPMALDFGVVYEGFRTGVSQGLFTITQPGQLNHTWIAEGRWLPAGAIDPNKHKKFSAPVIADDDKDAPPVLHRRAGSGDSGSEQNKDMNKNKNDEQKSASPSASPAPAPGAGSPTPSTSAPTSSTPSETAKPTSTAEAAKTPPPAASSTAASANATDETIADPNRPRLRRGKPDATAHQEPFATFDAADPLPGVSSTAPSTGKPDVAAKNPATSPPPLVTFPAISDAGGADARSYTYDLKPEEEASYRSKMLELAAMQLAPQPVGAAKPVASGKRSSKAASKPPQPAFDDVKMRIFDLTSANEPILVLSAKTHPLAVAAGANGSVEPKEITLIARSNLEGELRKLFFSQTDSGHLDVAPRMELIDAVDADGSGRGALLFRRTSDDGSSYAVYRVTADRLWPLFEGTP